MLSLPLRDFTIRPEDLIPAFAGAIGKVSLVAAFALAWMEGLGINSARMAAENIRLELFVASIFTLIFCVFINLNIAPPGTLAPLIPLIPLMAGLGAG